MISKCYSCNCIINTDNEKIYYQCCFYCDNYICDECDDNEIEENKINFPNNICCEYICKECYKK